jgi:uncharacterized protein YjbJ (UPF0337 family)
MDKDRVEGKLKDIKGRLERQAGEWTGDSDTQAKGAADQAKGKAQNAWGKLKDSAREAMDDANDQENESRPAVPRRDKDEKGAA